MVNKITETLGLEILFYDNNGFYNSYEEACANAGKENVKIGFAVVEIATGEIPEKFKDMYDTLEDALNAAV